MAHRHSSRLSDSSITDNATAVDTTNHATDEGAKKVTERDGGIHVHCKGGAGACEGGGASRGTPTTAHAACKRCTTSTPRERDDARRREAIAHGTSRQGLQGPICDTTCDTKRRQLTGYVSLRLAQAVKRVFSKEKAQRRRNCRENSRQAERAKEVETAAYPRQGENLQQAESAKEVEITAYPRQAEILQQAESAADSAEVNLEPITVRRILRARLACKEARPLLKRATTLGGDMTLMQSHCKRRSERSARGSAKEKRLPQVATGGERRGEVIAVEFVTGG